jgi:hypothetical protein
LTPIGELHPIEAEVLEHFKNYIEAVGLHFDDNNLPRSENCLREMQARLKCNGYTSFWN